MKPGLSWIPTLDAQPTPNQAMSLAGLTALYGIVSVAIAWMFVDRLLSRRATFAISLLFCLLLLLVLALLGNSAWKLFAALHPRPVLTMPVLVHRPGTSFPLAWTFPRLPWLLNHLSVSLKFTEAANYVAAEMPVEEQKVLLNCSLYEGEPGLLSGSALVAIPEHAMHSFATASHSLRWALHFDGKSPWPFCPPLHYEVPIIVGFWT